MNKINLYRVFKNGKWVATISFYEDTDNVDFIKVIVALEKQGFEVNYFKKI